MKQFADLHLLPNLKDKEQIEKIIHKAADLGYKLVGISLTPKTEQNIIHFLQETSRNYNVDLATRVDLTPKSSEGLLRSLRQFRRKFEIVAVRCFSKSVARQAAKDHRVDLLVFPSINSRERFFDNAEARLASQSSAALEVDMALLLASFGFSRVRLLSSLQREVEIAGKFDVPIVICSGAVDWLQLRDPYDFASLAMLFRMNIETALCAISVTPLDIVERNRKKLDSSYVARDISVVRREKNCTG